MRFRGVLLKSLDEQFDRDGDRIDPAGVTFDDREYPLLWEFDVREPIGFARVSRAEDGSLAVEGDLMDPSTDVTRLYASVGVGVNEAVRLREGTTLARNSDLLMVSLVREHVDPTQPNIVREELG